MTAFNVNQRLIPSRKTETTRLSFIPTCDNVRRTRAESRLAENLVETPVKTLSLCRQFMNSFLSCVCCHSCVPILCVYYDHRHFRRNAHKFSPGRPNICVRRGSRFARPPIYGLTTSSARSAVKYCRNCSQ